MLISGRDILCKDFETNQAYARGARHEERAGAKTKIPPKSCGWQGLQPRHFDRNLHDRTTPMAENTTANPKR